MKRNSRLDSMMKQFSYEHKKLDNQLFRVRKSADELSKLLDNMTPNEKKEEKK